MFSPRLAVPAVLAVAAATATAQTSGPITTNGLSILAPGGPNLWWVAGSDNTLAWTCQSTTFTNFTVLLGNTNPSVQLQPQAILAQENNFDCSKLITANNFGQSPGSGWFVQLSNPFNETDVWAQSDVFEIKPKGSAYPAASATPTESSAASTSGASGSGSSSASPTGGSAQTSNSPSPSPSNNAAAGMKASVTGLAAIAAAAFGIAFA
jgi:hypothetical protein